VIPSRWPVSLSIVGEEAEETLIKDWVCFFPSAGDDVLSARETSIIFDCWWALFFFSIISKRVRCRLCEWALFALRFGLCETHAKDHMRGGSVGYTLSSNFFGRLVVLTFLH
jgi:hypothetical protein